MELLKLSSNVNECKPLFTGLASYGEHFPSTKVGFPKP
jgi:hypothetical protein